ncbi:glycosyltransferase family 4 protein [Microbacterium gubbeenense]|uniref:glycosyltransferase family 4 protein n=1 Tax=Microbacterium gubbeenense TaxID=159896 RepID=UPI000A058F4B|nr:glycosyltransferase [Microbacterium gubbeenense]
MPTLFTPSPSEPDELDRVIIHQFDAARPSPGGIDTCIRGILKYASNSQRIAVIGVDTGVGPAWRKLGQWEKYETAGASFYFLPVVSLDPADQNRKIPHALRLIGGLLKHRRRVPSAAFVQAHRADTALAISMLLKGRLTYFIHTQESGLTGKTSDSVWRRAAILHAAIEKRVARRAERIAVFNPDYAKIVARWNRNTRGFPTWYDPELISAEADRVAKKVLWVGRVEVPKDPLLAVSVFEELTARDPEWTMDIVGSGTLLEQTRAHAEVVGPALRVHGRTAPEEVATLMARSDVFLMTSHPGYEGFPRVLVEAMASGCRPVVTDGSDTGSLVDEAVTGYVTGRDSKHIALRVIESSAIDRGLVRAVVHSFSAPAVIEDIYADLSTWKTA